MSFNGAAFLFPKEGNMAKWEIHKRFGIVDYLWWKFMPGTEITVKWPVGWTPPEPAPGGGFIQIESADPNDHYRPWLEQHVGRQGWDWNWKLGSIAAQNNDKSVVGFDTLKIKFRKGKDSFSSIAALKWS